MNNKNFKNNDHESCIEGIYGCMERIEAGIIELKKIQPNVSNSAVNNEANEILVQEIKGLVGNATGLNCRHTDRKIEEQTKVLNSNFSAISDAVRDVKAIINKSQSSGDVLNSLEEIKAKQQEESDKVKKMFRETNENIESGIANAKHLRISIDEPHVLITFVIMSAAIAVLSVALYLAKRPNYERIDNDLKYRYIKMKGDASAEQIATLEDVFELNRDNQKIEQMREDVETYEEAVRKQAALAEQARLKEQAAKEQETKAKSIKAKQEQPNDNTKSKN
mgnify:FL=1|jgi:hypothetical protein